jgi:cob(I)alamin adenosyltransferase
VSKDSLRVTAYGTVDELNSQIGVAIALGISDELGDSALDSERTV